jgi:glucose/arabinose dehydrogenase
MPQPYASPTANRHPSIAARPAGAWPKAPPGLVVELLASGLDGPRLLRVSPGGDIFVAESRASRIRVLRATDAAGGPEIRTFADNLDRPFGIAFWPPGPAPQYVYAATTGAVFRIPYRPGELQPAGPMETVVTGLPRGGHWTRDITFSKDGTRMFVAVGSRSNDAERALGGFWDAEEERADILVFSPEGKNERVFASGLRNCVGMAVQPATGDLWCSVNERDGLGDDLPPDYVTRVREGGFYGWPWFYIGGNEDPRHPGERPELGGEVALPDVLLQPHSALLEITFYDGMQFPAAYCGDAFVAFPGSWNRAKRTGYKVVRILLNQGQPTGEYEDFLTGFVIGDGRVWGRPVGVAADNQGTLLVSEDADGTIWRVSYLGGRPALITDRPLISAAP